MDTSGRQMMEAILSELRKITHQVNPLNSPTFAGDVSEKLTAIEKRLEKIEKHLAKSN